jgi:hypothetical protein
VVIADDEYEEAQRSLRAHGYKTSDFEVRDLPTPSQAGLFPPTAAITVFRKSTRTKRSYQPKAWTLEFERDLSTGVFGNQ